jgi:hypothetical protein
VARFLASAKKWSQAKVWDESNAPAKLPDAGYVGLS